MRSLRTLRTEQLVDAIRNGRERGESAVDAYDASDAFEANDAVDTTVRHECRGKSCEERSDLGDLTSCWVLVSSGRLGHSYAELRDPPRHRELGLRPTRGQAPAGQLHMSGPSSRTRCTGVLQVGIHAAPTYACGSSRASLALPPRQPSRVGISRTSPRLGVRRHARMDRAQREHRVTKSRSIMLWRGVLRAGVGLRGKRSRNKRHYTSDRSIKWPHAAHGELGLGPARRQSSSMLNSSASRVSRRRRSALALPCKHGSE